LQLNHYNFCQTNTFSPNRTNLPGVFVAGVFQSPKDIPETVIQGSSAAGSVAELINEARGSETRQKTYPEEFEVKDNEPRIGVFVCHCGINIASTVDVKKVVEYVSEFPNVVWSEDVLYACSQDCQENIKKKIKELNLNRVVVASCTPRTHEPLFQETIREVGMNRHLFEMANIREQCSWVHSKSPSLATQKAKVLVAMAIAKSRLLEPFHPAHTAVTPKALIIGGGLAGMTSALSLANQGFAVALVEKGELGGNLRHLYYTLSGENIQPILKGLITQIGNHPLVKVYKNSEVKEVQGYVGNFVTTLTTEEKIEHGVIIVATGGEEYKPTEYLYGSDDRILTQRELEEMIATKTVELKPNTSVVMIQCVGSREERHLYCSRVCCSTAIKNALKLKELEPTVNIYILYRDILTYAFQEDYYRKARESGIIFIRFEPESEPEVKREQDGKLMVTVSDTLLRERIVLKPDRIVLSTGILPASGNKKISEALKVPLDEDGFFLEAHVKLRPVDFANEGVFLCGLAHSPKSIDETISQAMAVVGRVGRILSRDYLEVEGVSAVIDPDKCAVCLTCLRVCPYDAPYINEKGEAEIKTIKCQGCGICAGECPAKAIQVQQFQDEQIIAMIDNFLVTKN
ncbi:MAG: FAD-dependent oxidoreductase, partial [Planctomycetota bacterium]|nr:FAD-dependent oxidoreductase [Planctomycetota bacterium]